jgi:hypothetical protein
MSQSLPAQSNAQNYRTKIGQRQSQVTAPYADSQGDGCAKIEPASFYGEDVESQIPILSSNDLADTNTCYDGHQYILVEKAQTCPVGFSIFDQSSVACKTAN